MQWDTQRDRWYFRINERAAPEKDIALDAGVRVVLTGYSPQGNKVMEYGVGIKDRVCGLLEAQDKLRSLATSAKQKWSSWA